MEKACLGFKGYYENPGSRGFKVKNDNNFRISKRMEIFRNDSVVNQERAGSCENLIGHRKIG